LSPFKVKFKKLGFSAALSALRKDTTSKLAGLSPVLYTNSFECWTSSRETVNTNF